MAKTIRAAAGTTVEALPGTSFTVTQRAAFAALRELYHYRRAELLTRVRNVLLAPEEAGVRHLGALRDLIEHEEAKIEKWFASEEAELLGDG